MLHMHLQARRLDIPRRNRQVIRLRNPRVILLLNLVRLLRVILRLSLVRLLQVIPLVSLRAILQDSLRVSRLQTRRLILRWHRLVLLLTRTM